MLYGGGGQGVQPSYIIEKNKFFDFGKGLENYCHDSWAAEMADVMYGEIERYPIRSLFNPRGLLLAQVGGATGKRSGQ